MSVSVTSSTAQYKAFGVKAAIFCAVLGALGCILTFFAIPVAPNISVNLYVIAGVLVGATCGPMLGMFAGAIGAGYTPVLWGWFGALPYNAALGLGVGLATRFGLRPTIGAAITFVIITPPSFWAEVHFLGTPIPVAWVGVGSTALQLGIVCAITEAIISQSALRRRLPRAGKIEAPNWIATNRWIRHPWVTVPEPPDRPAGTLATN